MIPSSCFYDFREKSSFASIIKVTKAFCEEHDIELKDFNLYSSESVKTGLLLFKRLRKTLRHKMKKIIYFSEKIESEHRETLKSIAEMNGATISESKEDATHLIYQHSHFRKPNREHCTPLKTWDDRVLVHWWFSPPSYQSWVDAELVPTTDRFENTALEPNTKWKLSHHWIENSYLFNEWMNEWDYQLNSSNMEHIGPAKHPVFKAFKPLDSGDPSLKRKDADLTSPAGQKKSRRSRNKPMVEEDLTKGNLRIHICLLIYLLLRNGKSRPISTSRTRRNSQHTACISTERKHSTVN